MPRGGGGSGGGGRSSGGGGGGGGGKSSGGGGGGGRSSGGGGGGRSSGGGGGGRSSGGGGGGSSSGGGGGGGSSGGGGGGRSSGGGGGGRSSGGGGGGRSSGGGGGGGGGGSSGGAGKSSGGSSGRSAGSASSSASAGRTYVDNSYNRSVGRVGMGVGSMVIPRSSSSNSSASNATRGSANNSFSSSSTNRTYVDNSYNRSVGRVGMGVGSMVISRSSDSNSSTSGAAKNSVSSSSTNRTYVDNSYNRNLGRVGEPVGSMVVSSSSGSNSQAPSSEKSVYVDNAFNRKLGRVGKPKGSMVESKDDECSTPPKTYVDNSMNRKLGRVGKPLGSMPVSQSSKTTQNTREAYDYFKKHQSEDIDWNQWSSDDYDQEFIQDTILSLTRRMNQVSLWQQETGRTGQPKTSSQLLRDYKGKVIEFGDLKLKDKIGFGAFGDVYFAEWKGDVVAVKKLKVQRVSQKRLKDFTDEVLLFCELDHPNVVRFLGACVVTPNLAIVMEYMQCSLFEALHYENIELTEEDRRNIIQQSAMGIQYLHGRDIAHCDIKSSNVLIHTTGGILAKLTDFGLSMMRNETETSVSASDCVKNVGTPRYSAPEVLRGELLDASAMKMADMYSYSLVVYEVCYDCEPFPSLNYNQLRTHVGYGTKKPDAQNSITVNASLLRLMEACWSRNPEERPNAENFLCSIQALQNIYQY